MEKLIIMGWEFTTFQGMGVTKNNISGELPKKQGLDDLLGTWEKRESRVILKGGSYPDAHYDLVLVHAGT